MFTVAIMIANIHTTCFKLLKLGFLPFFQLFIGSKTVVTFSMDKDYTEPCDYKLFSDKSQPSLFINGLRINPRKIHNRSFESDGGKKNYRPW